MGIKYRSVFALLALPLFSLDTIRVEFPDERVTAICELADDNSERERGLMFRKTLGEDECMVFLYDEESVMHFWMKNTYIPLSIAFASRSGVIVRIEDMKPLNLDTVSSGTPALYAIEANAGWFRRKGIRPRSRVRLVR